MRSKVFLFWIVSALSMFAEAKEIRSNELTMANAPAWLTQTRVEKVTDRIQNKLEWPTRRITVTWYATQAEFDKVHSFGALPTAVVKTVDGTSTMHLGPQVTNANFDEIFGHELVHVIIQQKYKDAIPKWLEEGLANHLAKRGEVDYKWLASQPFPADVKELGHPFRGVNANTSFAEVSYRYKASQAFAEMLAKKCDLENLIRLSVQRKMENYMVTYCEIKDLNAAFRDWVKKKAS